MATAIHSLLSQPSVFPSTALQKILTQAKARIANHIKRTSADVDGLDLTLMVIQKELGDLVYTKGNLSFLMLSAPILLKPFYAQLNPDIKYDYDGRQLAVWQQRLVNGEQFPMSANLNAAILPFLAEEERFTVIVFIQRKP